MKRRAFQFGGLAAASALLAGCFHDAVTRRIKLIATAEVDGQKVTGETVMELKWRPSGNRMYESEKGEALILELAGRGTVYITNKIHAPDGQMSSGIIGLLVNQAAGCKYPARAQKSELDLLRNASGKFKAAPYGERRIFPLMVAFKDENIKASVFEVKPADFAMHFGAVVEFVSLEIEFTEELLTQKLLKRLPMLDLANPDLTNVFPLDPPGKMRAFDELPFEFKMSEQMFFAYGGIKGDASLFHN